MAVNKFKDLNDVMHMQGFQNLVKGIQAQNMARVSLFEVIERKWKFFIAVLPENEKEQVSTFIQCLKDKNIKRIFTCTKGILLDCGHGNCETLLERLMNLSKVTALQENMGDANEAEIGKNETETAENSNSYSDSCFSYYWKLARLFIGVSIDDNIHLRDGLDSMALIKLMKNCRLFKFKDSDKVYDQVCEDRDAMVYAPDMQISKNRLNNIIRNLQIILENFSESFVSCSDATTYLSQLEPEVVNCDTIEYKLLVKNVFEAIDSALRLDKEMDFYGMKGRSEAWLASRADISSLLLQVNELLSEPEPDEVSELKTENENLKKEVQKTRNDLDSKCEVFQKEIKRLETENERLRRQLEALEELLSEPKPDILSELKMENDNLKKEVQTTRNELDSKFEVFKTEIKRLEKENENLRRHIETLEERLEQLNEVKATRNTADNLQSRMKKLELDREWFDTENRNLKETVKRLERERDDYKQKVHRLSGQSASNMEVTIGGSKVLHEKELLQGQKVTVLQGDIVQITADAIVHPTNSTFETRGAVGSALGKAGGDDFLRDVKALHLSHGTLEVAKAALSKGKNFPAKYVIHVHSPGWRHENAKQMLDAATKNVLTLAEEHNIRSIAIPSISSGHAGFPKLTAAETILRAINNYFSNSTSSLKQVYFVLFDAESVTAYITELRRLSV